MPYEIRDTVAGLGPLLEALKNLPTKLGKKALKDGVARAGKLVLWAARARTPKESGLLYRSLGAKTKVFRNSGVVVAIVGPRTGFRQVVMRGRKGTIRDRKGRERVAYRGAYPVLSNPTKYAHLVELGTKHSQAQPFLAPAFAAVRAQCQEVIESALRDALAGGSL